MSAEPIPLPRSGPAHGWALLGVVRAPDPDLAWDPADPAMGVVLVREGDLAALVAPAPPPGTDADADHLAARHWEVHRALLRDDVVPAPVGVVFSDPEGVRAFLTESHAGLTGALERVARRWEFRLHVDVVDSTFSRGLALDLSTHIYAELRRISAAAVTLPVTHQRVLSAAFLVDRGATAAFQDRLEVLARLNSALGLDLTGPWPPYDFVTMAG
ncbi:GvpL/GvpF family gas vesicle protein [Longimicrobium sp.]|uniref:GvpL/GvpF family gas vesicle protein n=1 Tax=Longimicrobium sp. TaxID=2029185 RepID=UPI003B3A3BB9